MDEIAEKATHIKLLICDVDGVLTDGNLHIGPEGIKHLSFSVHDGFGLKLLMASGIEVAIVTVLASPIVDTRMKQLGIKHYFKNQHDKCAAYEDLRQRFDLKDEQIACVGDDFVDLPMIRRAGLGIAVADAAEGVQKQATWVTTRKGGDRAVREICEFIMHAQNTYDDALKHYLK